MAAGRPPIYETVEQMQEAVDQYFLSLEAMAATVTGLALFLGFESRQSLYDYEGKEEFSYIIKRAKLRVEMMYELKLSGSSCTGAIFALKNMGWKDKQEVENSGSMSITKISVIDVDGTSI